MIHSRGVNNTNQKAIQAGYGSGVHHQQKTPIQVQMDPHRINQVEENREEKTVHIVEKKKNCVQMQHNKEGSVFLLLHYQA
jgi:hypothetical protein